MTSPSETAAGSRGGTSAQHLQDGQGRPRQRPLDYEIDFLPAALEVTHKPPSPTARWTALLLVSLIGLLILWAAMARVDVVATAAGRIQPTGSVKVVQPLEAGTVRRVAVRDGDHVVKDQVLVELDPTQTMADRIRAEQELVQTRLDLARLRALAIGDIASFVPPPGADAAAIDRTRRRLLAEIEEAGARTDAIARQIAQRRAEHATQEATLERLRAALPFLTDKANMRAELFRLKGGSRLNLIEARQSLKDAQMETTVVERQMEEVTSAIAVLESSLVQARAEHMRMVLADLADREQHAMALEQELVKIAQRHELQTLRAPVTGTVQQVAVHTIGGVVTSAQTLMVIVPEDAELEIVATLANKDVGFVVPGQPVEVKVEAFSFTRYGLVPGRVTRISSTSVGGDAMLQHETAQGAGGPDNGTGTETAGGGQPVYLVHIALDRLVIETENGPAALRPGLAVQAEVKTGSRTVMEYLLSPLQRHRSEALRER